MIRFAAGFAFGATVTALLAAWIVGLGVQQGVLIPRDPL